MGRIRLDNADFKLLSIIHGILKEPHKQWVLSLNNNNKYLKDLGNLGQSNIFTPRPWTFDHRIPELEGVCVGPLERGHI